MLDGNTSLLENLVAVNLLRKYGRSDSVFFYNKGIEVDFYVPEAETAIQVCYDLTNADTFDREVNALLKLSKTLDCKKMLIITGGMEKNLKINKQKIEVIPAWKWLLES